jgi:hypothetical protein
MDEENRKTVEKSYLQNFDQMVQKIMITKGLDREVSIDVLSCHDWNLDKAFKCS